MLLYETGAVREREGAISGEAPSRAPKGDATHGAEIRRLTGARPSPEVSHRDPQPRGRKVFHSLTLSQFKEGV